MTTAKTLLTAVLFLAGAAALAQGAAMEDARSHREVLAMGLFPPDIIMRHQQRLGITDEQRASMLKLVQKFQNDVAELQWKMENEQQQMRQALAENRIDAAAVLPRVERVLQMESEFKLAHFRLLIGIKNELDEEQIEMIRQHLRKRRS